MVSVGKKESEVEAPRRKRRQLVYFRRGKLTRLAEESEGKGQSRLAPNFLVLIGPLTKTESNPASSEYSKGISIGKGTSHNSSKPHSVVVLRGA